MREYGENRVRYLFTNGILTYAVALTQEQLYVIILSEAPSREKRLLVNKSISHISGYEKSKN